MLYHHCRSLEHVQYESVTQQRWDTMPQPPAGDCSPGCDCLSCCWEEQTQFYDPAYRWVQETCGFFPLFLAVGAHPDSQRITGYANQWGRKIVQSRDRTWYRQPGEFPNRVLFSWEDMPHPQLVHQDYSWWHLVLMSVDYQTGEVNKDFLGIRTPQCVYKRSWSVRKWQRMADNDPASVQAVVPQLDLRTANLVRCRNQSTRRQLIKMGWTAEQVRVEQWAVDRW